MVGLSGRLRDSEKTLGEALQLLEATREDLAYERRRVASIENKVEGHEKELNGPPRMRDQVFQNSGGLMSRSQEKDGAASTVSGGMNGLGAVVRAFGSLGLIRMIALLVGLPLTLFMLAAVLAAPFGHGGDVMRGAGDFLSGAAELVHAFSPFGSDVNVKVGTPLAADSTQADTVIVLTD